MSKRLIVNADDFGLDAHTVEWTIRGFECGALASATIMAGMPATDMAVSYAKAHSEFSFGVHLCLVDERPLCATKDIPSLVDPATGRLWRTRQFIVRNFAGLVKVEDLKREIRAQYCAIRDAGIHVSHVDGHGHNHRLPQAIRALAELKTELGIHVVRRCQDLAVPGGSLGLLSRAINGPMQRRLAAAGFRMTDHFLMNAGHTGDRDWFSKALRALPDGVTEIGIHPGFNEPWRRVDAEDCFANCRRLCGELGVTLANFRDL